MKTALRVFAILCLLIAAGVWVATRTPSSPFDGRPASAEISIEKGAYAARLADCVACHTAEGGAPFAGGLAMAVPMLGAIYSTNITSDKLTGVGDWTLAEFDNAVRRGVGRDGRRLYPAMPYPSYAKMDDAEVEQLYAYFTRHVDPVAAPNRPSEIPAPMNTRWPLAFWNAVFSPDKPYTPDTSKSDAWNRGAYLVQGPGHCGSCHTPRGVAMQEQSLDESSDAYLSGALLDGWYAPSLRGDPGIGLADWSEDDIVAYLRDGRNRHGVVFGSMLEAFNNSTQFMTDADLSAMAVYLKSLGPSSQNRRTIVTYDRADILRPADDAGAWIYATRCATCHGADGKGRAPSIPPLAGVSSMLADSPESAINVTLNGGGRLVKGGLPDLYRMPQMRASLTDAEIAQVLTYARGAWGNTGGAVDPKKVRELRNTTDPASSEVIILQMR